jgi:anti-sigma regulatory factor (Ser/Thr protein kinase)
MFVRNEEGNLIVYKISSEWHHIDSVLERCTEDLSRFNIVSSSSSSSSSSSEFKVIVRELLNNAISHGNREIAEKVITLRIEYLGARRFKIVVEDQGRGFNYRNITMDIPENTENIRRKGYVLINAFSKRIEFNEKGNRISVYTEIGY